MATSQINVQSVLVEHTYKGKVLANSGCLLDNRYVLMTSNVLIPLLNDSKVPLRSIRSGEGLLNPSTFFDETPKITVVIKNEDSDNHQYKQAVIAAAYVSDTIRKFAVKYLYDWTIDVDCREAQLKEALSLFFVATINLDTFTVEDLLQCFDSLKRQSSRVNLRVGDKVCVESAPFGNRHFLRCHSRGIVANVLGENNTFILTDVPTAPGSEGSPVFAKFRNNELPIGIVLSCMSWWKGEWIGLTLSAPFETVFDEILGGNKISPKHCLKSNALLDILYKNVAQVTCGTLWGTAMLLNRDSGIFVTNSHVIESETPTLHWNDINIKCRVLYKSTENHIFDIAILCADQRDVGQTEMVSVKLSSKRPNIGDKVYALGFPLFPRSTKPKPTVTSGHVSQTSKTMVKTSCTVLPGASGGGIFTKDGTLAGLIVCNAKMEENSTAYPRVNMAIPIAAIYDVLIEFLRKNDITLLERLREESIRVVREWNFLKGKM